MKLHEVIAAGRALALRLERPSRADRGDVLAWSDEIAKELRHLMNELARSGDARRAEVRAHGVLRGRAVVEIGGRRVTVESVFRKKAA